MPAQLSLHGISFSFPDRRVLTDVSLTVGPTDRIGLVGENGGGKTTLLRIAAGVLVPSSGDVIRTRRGGGEVTHQLVAQEAPSSRRACVREVLADATAHV